MKNVEAGVNRIVAELKKHELEGTPVTLADFEAMLWGLIKSVSGDARDAYTLLLIIANGAKEVAFIANVVLPDFDMMKGQLVARFKSIANQIYTERPDIRFLEVQVAAAEKLHAEYGSVHLVALTVAEIKRMIEADLRRGNSDAWYMKKPEYLQ